MQDGRVTKDNLLVTGMEEQWVEMEGKGTVGEKVEEEESLGLS